MGEVAKLVAIPESRAETQRSALWDCLLNFRSREVVFGVVGYAGSGTSFVATRIAQLLGQDLGDRRESSSTPIKARNLLDQFTQAKKIKLAVAGTKIERVTWYQGVGDQLRQTSGECGAVAAYAIRFVQQMRQQDIVNVFLLDSLKRPGEVELLRNVYGEAFCLVGVGCRPDVRRKRLELKFAIPEDSAEPTILLNATLKTRRIGSVNR